MWISFRVQFLVFSWTKKIWLIAIIYPARQEKNMNRTFIHIIFSFYVQSWRSKLKRKASHCFSSAHASCGFGSTFQLSFWCTFLWNPESNIFVISKRTVSKVREIQILLCGEKMYNVHVICLWIDDPLWRIQKHQPYITCKSIALRLY